MKKRDKSDKYQKPNTLPVFSLLIVITFILNGIVGKYFMPSDPMLVSMADKYIPPFFMGKGSLAHILGTDYLGRDVFSRVIMGGQVSLVVSLTAIFAGGCVGTFLGLAAGFFGKLADKIIMRLSDAMIAFPGVLLAMLLGISLGSGFLSVVLAIAFSIWPRFTKIIRGQVLSLKERSFIVQTRVMGGSDMHIILRHLLPNQLNTVIVLLVQVIGSSILMEAGLSFLGLSVQPPNPTWGGMVSDGKNTFNIAWWGSAFPAIAIAITVIGFNLMGEWLKRRLDPKGGN
jgi:peptide/nickel transport system permease protein